MSNRRRHRQVGRTHAPRPDWVPENVHICEGKCTSCHKTRLLIHFQLAEADGTIYQDLDLCFLCAEVMNRHYFDQFEAAGLTILAAEGL